MVTELAANAVVHGSALGDGCFEVAGRRDGPLLTIEVTDAGGSGTAEVVEASPRAVAGRGLQIVAALTRTWWVTQGASRHTVHAQLDIQGPPHG